MPGGKLPPPELVISWQFCGMLHTTGVTDVFKSRKLMKMKGKIEYKIIWAEDGVLPISQKQVLMTEKKQTKITPQCTLLSLPD